MLNNVNNKMICNAQNKSHTTWKVIKTELDIVKKVENVVSELLVDNLW